MNNKKPFIFVSYAHKDNEVYQLVKELEKRHYSLWYDKKIKTGTHWTKDIASAILDSSVFLAIISENYLESENCRNELEFAIDENKELILIFIQDVTLTPELRMQLGRKQAIIKNNCENHKDFVNKICEVQSIKKCFSFDFIADYRDFYLIHEQIICKPDKSIEDKINIIGFYCKKLIESKHLRSLYDDDNDLFYNDIKITLKTSNGIFDKKNPKTLISELRYLNETEFFEINIEDAGYTDLFEINTYIKAYFSNTNFIKYSIGDIFTDSDHQFIKYNAIIDDSKDGGGCFFSSLTDKGMQNGINKLTTELDSFRDINDWFPFGDDSWCPVLYAEFDFIKYSEAYNKIKNLVYKYLKNEPQTIETSEQLWDEEGVIGFDGQWTINNISEIESFINNFNEAIAIIPEDEIKLTDSAIWVSFDNFAYLAPIADGNKFILCAGKL